MDVATISRYFEKPCRFRLRSGKEIFGVLWEESTLTETRHFFSSSENYKKIISGNALGAELKTPVDVDDFVAAEALQGVVPGKDMFK